MNLTGVEDEDDDDDDQQHDDSQPGPAGVLLFTPTGFLQSAPNTTLSPRGNRDPRARLPNGNSSCPVDRQVALSLIATVSAVPGHPSLAPFMTSNAGRVQGASSAMSRDMSSQGSGLRTQMAGSSAPQGNVRGASDDEDKDAADANLFLVHAQRTTLSDYYPRRTTGGDYGPLSEHGTRTRDPSEHISHLARLRSKVYRR